MKLCTSSLKFSHLIDIILKDDSKRFKLFMPQSLNGQIDKMLFFNFCISSSSFKILKLLINHKDAIKTGVINISTVKSLLKNKKLTVQQKTYIYRKLIKHKINITDSFLLKLISKYDQKCIFWLNSSKSLKKNDFILLFNDEINIFNTLFCRKHKVSIIPLLFQRREFKIINFEEYTDFFTEQELIILVNKCLKVNKNYDLNLLDSAIKILINNQSIIDKIDINALSERKIINDDFFSFLNIDIDNILMYKKFSKPIYKNKVKKI